LEESWLFSGKLERGEEVGKTGSGLDNSLFGNWSGFSNISI